MARGSNPTDNITLKNTTYYLEDWQKGTMSDLETTEKSTLVGAINSVVGQVDGIKAIPNTEIDALFA